MSIFCSHISYTASAETLRGDANSSGTIDAVDMVLMKIFLLSGFNYNYIYDVTMDNNVNIIDIVRMKKFLCGYMQKNYVNEEKDVFSWAIAVDGVWVTTLNYTVTSNCFVETDCLSERYVYRTECFAKTDAVQNMFMSNPDIEIGRTRINSSAISLTFLDDVLVERNWIWDKKVSTQEVFVHENSDFDCIIIGMCDDAIIPYHDFINDFKF